MAAECYGNIVYGLFGIWFKLTILWKIEKEWRMLGSENNILRSIGWGALFYFYYYDMLVYTKIIRYTGAVKNTAKMI